MGCGTQTSESAHEHAAAIKITVSPMWDTLPKNRWGKLDWHMVRYAAHRYFMQQYNMLVNGLEPTKHVNESSLGSADILTGRGESILNVVLNEKVTGQGFSLDDITLMLTTLERVIFDTEAFRLEQAYWELKHDSSAVLSASQLKSVISTYMTIWTHQGNDTAGAGPRAQWKWINFAEWLIAKMKFDAARNPRAGSGRAAMERTFSFEDVHQAVGDLTKNAASYWAADCRRMKSALVKMDKAGTGRIPISDFYGAKADGDQRFAESEAYLRDLGALDETSALLGKQALLANYLQGASNCFVTTPHYMVCCASECEELLNDIQDAVVAPEASVEEIWALVKGTSSFDDEPPALDNTLYRQLQRIAQKHEGRIPCTAGSLRCGCTTSSLGSVRILERPELRAPRPSTSSQGGSRRKRRCKLIVRSGTRPGTWPVTPSVCTGWLSGARTWSWGLHPGIVGAIGITCLELWPCWELH